MNQAGIAGAGAVSGFFSEIGRFDVFGIDRRFGRVAAQVGEFPGTFGEYVQWTRGLGVGILLPMFTRSKADSGSRTDLHCNYVL